MTRSVMALFLVALVGCGGGGAVPQAAYVRAPPGFGATPSPVLTLTSTTDFTAGTQTIVVAAGTAPYTATLYGNCATLDPVAIPGTFVLRAITVGTAPNTFFKAGACTLGVRDDTGQARAASSIGFSPPRTFLTASGSVPRDALGIYRLAYGATMPIAVTETLVGSVYGAPFTLLAAGSCASILPGPGSVAGDGAFVATMGAGSCYAVFGDALGQAVALNFANP